MGKLVPFALQPRDGANELEMKLSGLERYLGTLEEGYLSQFTYVESRHSLECYPREQLEKELLESNVVKWQKRVSYFTALIHILREHYPKPPTK